MGKLYYEDSDLAVFTARVTSCTPLDRHWQVTLDRTAFYPEGGGQACDLGRLADARVLDVREKDGRIVHLCDAPLAVGSTVEGRLDWARRLDLMQQHTGEHILSGIICRRYGYHNVGFHVGAQAMEIDFDGPIPPEDLADIELEANRAIWENLPVTCWYPEEAELPNIPYRTKKALPWPVRLVRIPGYDTCACCGVHLKHTGQIGLIKILSCVKFHAGVRLELVCGKRAYDFLRNIFDQNRQISQLLSAKLPETAQAVTRMSQQLSQEKLRSANLEKQVFQSIAESYVNQRNVLHFAQDLTPGGVRELADRIAAVVSGWAAVCSGTREEGYSLCILSRTENVRQLGTDAAAALNGRGGGKPNAFQGSLRSTQEDILAYFTPLL